MELKEAKLAFIDLWGRLGSQWGINKTMAQIHALLLASNQPLSTEDIMEELQISRGNANMNIRALIDWQLAEKTYQTGERRDFFVAEKDMWTIGMNIIRERRRREIEPILKNLDSLSQFKAKNQEGKDFLKVVKDLKDYTGQLNQFGRHIESADQKGFLKWIMNRVT